MGQLGAACVELVKVGLERIPIIGLAKEFEEIYRPESVLDEFPGIGDQRKAALLKKFGSVHRLRLATVEEIGQVPGFGGKAAAELKAFLVARTSPGAPPADRSEGRPVQ